MSDPVWGTGPLSLISFFITISWVFFSKTISYHEAFMRILQEIFPKLSLRLSTVMFYQETLIREADLNWVSVSYYCPWKKDVFTLSNQAVCLPCFYKYFINIYIHSFLFLWMAFTATFSKISVATRREKRMIMIITNWLKTTTGKKHPMSVTLCLLLLLILLMYLILCTFRCGRFQSCCLKWVFDCGCNGVFMLSGAEGIDLEADCAGRSNKTD